MFSCTTAQHNYCKILYKLYSLQLNCTYSNYTQAATTFSAAQQHTNCPADVFCSAVQPLFDTACVYIDRQSHPLTRLSTQIQFTLNAPPQPHNATQHTSMFLSGDCQAAHFTYPSVQVGWRNSANLRHPTRNSRTSTFPVWLNVHAASDLHCLLLHKNHSHCSMPFTVMQTPFVVSQAIVSRAPSNLLRREWTDWCGPLAVGASLVVLGWPTVTKVVRRLYHMIINCY